MNENGDRREIDPNVDYGRLWLAVHNYLIAQTSLDATVIGKAFGELADAHNLIYERYVSEQGPTPIAGLE